MHATTTSAGKARSGETSPGAALHRRRGAAGQRQARSGTAGFDRLGPTMLGSASQAWLGKAGQGTTGHGTAQHDADWHRRPGFAREGEAYHDTNREGESGVKMAPNFSPDMKTTALTKQIPAAECVRNLAAIHGHITPQIVLDEARIKTSPLHAYFEWNNSAAAEKFRLVQAAALIRRIKVTIEAQPERTINVRAFVNVSQPCEPEEDAEDDMPTAAASIYVTVQEALTNAPYRAQLLADCRRDIAAFRSKYAALEEAAGILDAMTQFSTPTPTNQ